MVEANSYLVIGRVLSAYGLNGWVKIKSFTQPETNFIQYQNCLIAPDGDSEKHWRSVTIEQGKAHGKGLVVKFAGCNDRTAAEALFKSEVAIRLEDLPDLADDDYYWYELEGLQVWATTANALEGTATDKQLLLGVVNHLLETGSNDVVVVRPCEGSIDKRERLLPYRPEVILDIDLNASRMMVDWDPDF